MALLNYTTKIAADKTVAEIHRMLARAGAKQIMNDYDDQGYIMGVAFRMEVNGNLVGFKLPSDWHPVQRVLEEQWDSNHRIDYSQEQALRVSWRVIKDWIEAQLAIIETQMVKPEEVFLPYMMQGDRTLYDRMLDSNFLLGEPK